MELKDACTHEREGSVQPHPNPSTHSWITEYPTQGNSEINLEWIKLTDTNFRWVWFFLFSPKFTHCEVYFALDSKRHDIHNRVAFTYSLHSCSWAYLSPLQPYCSSLTHWDLFSCWQTTVSIWCHIIHGRNTWIHSSLWPYNSVQ